MSISAAERALPTVEDVQVNGNAIRVELSDGRSISVPLAWFPRLAHATPAERSRWRLIGRGQGIHWVDIDEDVSVEGLLAGRPSAESQASFKRWLAARPARRRRGTGQMQRATAIRRARATS